MKRIIRDLIATAALACAARSAIAQTPQEVSQAAPRQTATPPARVADGTAGYMTLPAATATTSYMAFDHNTASCSNPTQISYQLPDPNVFPGPTYPVFIYVPATFALSSGPTADKFINGMAARGFLSVKMSYENDQKSGGCTNGNGGGFIPETQCIFDASANPQSAIAAICNLPQADCSQGVAVAGHSQGAGIAILAKNYAAQVTGAYALSMSSYNRDTNTPQACLTNTNIANADALRVVNGASDPAFGNQSDVQAMMPLHQCAPGTVECGMNTGSGAGWYLVQDSQVADGYAGHCYFNYQPNAGPSNPNSECLTNKFDQTWLNSATQDWALNPNLDWLAAASTNGAFLTQPRNRALPSNRALSLGNGK